MSRTAPTISSDTDPKPETPRLVYRRKQLADALGVSTVTLWRNRSALPAPIEILPGIQGWLADDITKYLAERRGAK